MLDLEGPAWPLAGERFDLLNATPERIDQKSKEKSEINSRATRANSELFASDVKGTLRNTVADEVVKTIQRRAQGRKSVSLSERIEDDQKCPDKNDKQPNRPNPPSS